MKKPIPVVFLLLGLVIIAFGVVDLLQGESAWLGIAAGFGMLLLGAWFGRRQSGE